MQDGYVKTLGGYRLTVPKDGPHKAVNYFVQGTAGWIITLALIEIYEYFQQLNAKSKHGYYIIMQVHDELVLDLPANGKDNDKVLKKVRRIMSKAADKVGVPVPTSIKKLPESWASAV